MNRSGQIVFLAGLASLILSCSKKEDPGPSAPADQTRYFISGNVTQPSGGPPGGNISSFRVSGAILVDQAYGLNSNPITEWISDFITAGDKMYIARAISPVIEIISHNDMQFERSVKYSKAATGNYYKHLVIAGNKLIVADRGFIPNTPFDNESYLKVIHLDNLAVIDSIPIVKNQPIWSMATINNKIFVSTGIYPSQGITVIDANTNTILDVVSVSGVCSDLLVDKDNNLLVFLRTKMIKLSGANHSVLSEKNVFISQLNVQNEYATSSTSVSLDRENNVLYYLSSAPQPASAPYLLNSYNLNTDVQKGLMTEFIGASTISFDQKNQVIVLTSASGSAGGGTIKTFTTGGASTSQFSLRNLPTKVMITQ